MDDENRPILAKDLKHCFTDFQQSFTLSVRNEISLTVRSEINAAIAPLQQKQKDLQTELEATKLQVSEIVIEHTTTRTKLVELENKLQSSNTPSLLARPSVSAITTSSTLEAGRTDTNNQSQAALAVLRDAKRIQGFSPITASDVEQIKANSTNINHEEALNLAVRRFLCIEMNISESISNSLSIEKIFPPANKADWNTLYVVFKDPLTIELLNQYVKFLKPGKSLSIYVPHSLYPRFSAISNIAHSYRNSEIKHKTKIKYGINDFELLVKPKN